MATRDLKELQKLTPYEVDAVGWAVQQAELMRRRRFDLVDWEHVIEEIEDVGKSERRAIESRAARIIEHLLKLDFSTDAYPRAKWRGSASLHRGVFKQLLAENRSLNARLPQLLAAAWADAHSEAEKSLRDDEFRLVPDALPYTPEQLLDDRYFGERDAAA